MMRERVTTPGRQWRPAIRIAVLATAVALLAFAVAGTVVAKPTAPKVKSQPFMVQAIVSVEASGTAGTAGTFFTASVIKGNHAMKAFISHEVTFTVSPSTVILKINKDGATIMDPDDLAVGDRVLINGRIERTKTAPPVFKARLIRDRGPVPTKT